MTTRDRLVGIVAAIALLAGFGIVGAIESEATPTRAASATPAPADVALFRSIFNDPSTPACEYEDGSELTEVGQACKWDAGTSGNRVGESYVVLAVPSAIDESPVGLVYLYSDGSIEL